MTVTVAASAAGLAAADAALAAGCRPAPSLHQWDVGILANGRYKLVVSATPTGGGDGRRRRRPTSTVDRTLGAFLATPALVLAERRRRQRHDDARRSSSPSRRPSQVAIQRAGVNVATVFAAQVGPGIQVIGWDGTSNGVAPARRRLRRGRHAPRARSGRSRCCSRSRSTRRAPVLTLLDGRDAALRPERGGDA